ncbi:hypothetical protein BC826DRAFT_1027974, partial [Russula brevipes]
LHRLTAVGTLLQALLRLTAVGTLLRALLNYQCAVGPETAPALRLEGCIQVPPEKFEVEAARKGKVAVCTGV